MKSLDFYKLILSLFLVLLFGCNQNQIDQSSNQIVVRQKFSPSGMNPIINVASASSDILPLLYYTLAEYNPKTLLYEAQLAKELPQYQKYIGKDNISHPAYSFNLREDATWDDGKPVSCEDYVFTMKLIKCPAVNSPRYRAALSEVIDAFYDSEKQACFALLETENMIGKQLMASIPILPEHILDPNFEMRNVTFEQLEDDAKFRNYLSENPSLKEVIDNFNRAGVQPNDIPGAGPYKITALEFDQYIVLEKKKDHWSQQYDSSALFDAYPDRIVYEIIPDEAMAMSKLKNGQIDIMPNISITDYNSLQENPQYAEQLTFDKVRIPQYYYIGLNMRSEELKFDEVRQALRHIVNVDTIIATYDNHNGVVIQNPFLHLEPKASENAVFDLDLANQILESNGWGDADNDGIKDKTINGEFVELSIDITSTNRELGQFITNLMTQDARKIGIEINLDAVDNTELRRKVRSHDFEMVLSGARQSLVPYDPYLSFHTDNLGPGKGNNFGFGNPTTDSIIESIRSEMDDSKRINFYQKLSDALNKELPVLYLYSPLECLVYKKQWKGLTSVKEPGYFPQSFQKVQ